MLAWLIFELQRRGSIGADMSDTAVYRLQGMLVGGLLTALVTGAAVIVNTAQWRQEAVSHGAAAYDPVTGVWHWKESAVEKE